jgi:hypothetical protein
MQVMSSINVSADCLSFDHIEIRDTDVARFFEETPEAQRLETFQAILRVGVAAIRSTRTAAQMDYVERRFEELSRQFESRLDSYMGDGGSFATAIQTYFGEDGRIRKHLDGAFGESGDLGKRLEAVFGPQGALVRQLLDPTNPTSPLGALKQDILSDLGRLRQDLAKDKQRATDMAKMAAKGGEFEDELYELLGAVARPYADRVEPTGSEVGLVYDCKKGDYTVTLSSRQDLKVAVEAKRRGKRATLPSILGEMDLAMRNRGAQYGMFVARNVGNLPAEVGWFNEYNDSLVVLALSESEEVLPRQELLEIGYRWARLRVLTAHAYREGGVNVTAIQQHLTIARRTLDELAQAKGTCTKITDQASSLRLALDSLGETLKAQLERIENELGEKATPSVARE